MFGLQFLLIPEFFLTQFFDKTWDDHHIFFARFMGVLILGNSALLKVCDPEVTFPVAAITQAAVALLGPLKAQFTLGRRCRSTSCRRHHSHDGHGPPRDVSLALSCVKSFYL